ncbi:MAG: CooT family nickel-binding protein [Anaerolineae bacterium]|nr:CooT family nickel-binding protein [Anaerolineae bacterium]
MVDAYLNGEKLIENVTWVEPTDEGVLVRSYFEPSRTIKARIQAIDLTTNRVLLLSGDPTSSRERLA